eukprot:5546775-Pleurochrysis_carterae.AAC.1
MERCFELGPGSIFHSISPIENRPDWSQGRFSPRGRGRFPRAVHARKEALAPSMERSGVGNEDAGVRTRGLSQKQPLAFLKDSARAVHGRGLFDTADAIRAFFGAGSGLDTHVVKSTIDDGSVLKAGGFQLRTLRRHQGSCERRHSRKPCGGLL